MTFSGLLSHLQRNNVSLWLEEGRLRYKGSAGVITDELLKELRQHKDELIAFLFNVNETAQSSPSPICPVSRDAGEFPLSFAQQSFWFLEQLEPGNYSNHLASAIRLRGPLNKVALTDSINEIIRRHEILRTTFVSRDEQPVQVINPSREISITEIDLQGTPEIEREEELQRIITGEIQKPFDLRKDPLIRVTLFKLADEVHVLLLTMHHIISDGISCVIFYLELGVFYSAFSNGKPSPLSELPVQYADYAVWQRERLQGDMLKNQLVYWKKQLGGNIPVLELPVDKPRPLLQTYRGARRYLSMDSDNYKALKALSRQEGCSLFMTLIAILHTLLYRYTSQEDIITGSPIAVNSHAETENIIGLFLNMILLRTDLRGNPTFSELMKRVRDVTLGAYSNQDVPFEKLVEELHPERDPGRNALFQIMLQLSESEDLELPGLDLTPLDFDPGSAQFDLAVHLWEGPAGMTGFFEYNTDLFETVTIERMAGHFQTLINSVITNPGQHISELPLLTPEEKKQFVEWNDTQVDYPKNVCLHQLVEAQVERTPEAVALIYEGEHLTYGKMNVRANRLAHYLRKLGVGPGVLVGLYMERSLEMVIGLLGIIKAGGVYIPLDPSYPLQRITFMLEDSEAAVLVTQERLIEQLPVSGMKIVCVDRDWDEVEHEQPDNLTASSGPEDLSYVIYTSGSTGKPKGVAISHGALVNFLWSMKHEPGLTEQDVLLSVTTLSFDIAALEIYLPLIVGARTVLISQEVAMDGPRLIAQLDSAGATVMQATPATWRLLLQAGWKCNPHLKVLIGGEALTQELASELLDQSAEVWNMYGPTETTIWSTIWQVEREQEKILIGRPIANTQVYILDRHMHEVPFGVSGELYIGGDGLAREYLKRPELTSEKFIVNPINILSRDGEQAADRIYSTGDLARWLPGGLIECLGRTDHQVKIRGFRIELGEIEAVLSAGPEVQHCVVVAREDTPGDKRLVAYLVPHDEAPAIDTLRQKLKKELADYMIPSAFVMLDRLPLTPNGKVDRKALPAPDSNRPELENVYIGPRTSTEELLANIWSEVLVLKQVGVNDNFFELGGHSLLATQIISLIRSAFEMDLPLRSIFESPTAAELAEALLQSADDRETVEKRAALLQRINELSDDEVDTMLSE